MGHYARGRARLFVVLTLLAGGFAAWRLTRPLDAGDSLGLALRKALFRAYLEVDASSVVPLSSTADAIGSWPVLFRARKRGELYDVYFARVRGPSATSISDVWLLTNLTRSSSADEGALVRSGDFVAFASRVGARFDALVVMDTRGESASVTQGWSRTARVRNAITNLQETGRVNGFSRVRFSFMEPAARLTITPREYAFDIDFDGTSTRVRTFPISLRASSDDIEVRPYEKANQTFLTWAVDTVRNVSWIGPKPIEWLEHEVFALKDRVDRIKHSWFGSNAEDAASARADLAVPARPPSEPDAPPAAPPLTQAEQREIGWPPAPIQPQISPVLEGEGEWVLVQNDPFVQTYPGAPPAFAQTFLRVDPERTFARVMITMWDARLVDLHIAMGTREPESATGETGTGLIPRDDETLSRLVGGFNGGFQAMHGEFGMMAEGRTYLPPKPWAATVAVYDDGRASMGSWEGPTSRRGGYDAEEFTRQIPADMIAMRQNLTSVVEDGRYNPWSRWWWGAAPEAAAEQTYTHRTGLCVTADQHVAYFWGPSMGPEALGAAMNAVHCVRGIHLDMNSKHTGMEFYRVSRLENGATAPREHEQDGTWEGPLPYPESALGGWMVRSRKAVRSMDPMRFPRYIRRDPRDYFYLTLRPVLPGPALASGENFVAHAIAPRVWPPATALASNGGVRYVRIDASRVTMPRPNVAQDASSPVVGAWTQALSMQGPLALEQVRTSLGLRWRVAQAQSDGDHVLVRGDAVTAATRACLGLDADGFLVYIERAEDGAVDWSSVLTNARVAQSVDLGAARFSLCEQGRCQNVFGAAAQLDASLAVHADLRPRARVLNPDNTPMPYNRWGGLQGTRVRYIPEGPPRFVAPPGAQ